MGQGFPEMGSQGLGDSFHFSKMSTDIRAMAWF